MADAAPLPSERQEVDLSELRVPILEEFSWLAMAVAWVWIAVLLNRERQGLGSLLPPCALLLGALAGLFAKRLRPAQRSWLLLLGLAVVLVPWPRWPVTGGWLYFQSLAVSLAALLIGPAGAFVAAGLLSAATLTLLRWQGPGAPLGPLGLVWATALLAWLSSRGLYTVLSWALASQRRAQRAADEANRRREQLRRTVDSLRTTHGLLERTTRELELARREAETARRLRSEFAANISHELRTPLNIILGFAEIMDRTPEVYGQADWPAMLRRDILEIRRNARHLSTLVDDILDLARLDALRMPIRREPSELAPVLQEAVDIVSRLLENKPVRLVVALDEGLPRLDMDPTRIRQVLINLLANACRFTERGSVTVAAHAGEDEVIVAVQDTGAGIPPEQLQRIFDEFTQAEAWRRPEEQGKGLGLAIARHLVGLHGGRIWAESSLGSGSTFSFALPLKARQVAVPVRTERPLPASAERPSLLLWELGQGAGAYLARHLEDYEVVAAADAPGLAEAVERLHPAALLVNGPSLEKALSAALGAAGLPEGLPLLACSLPARTPLPQEGLLAALLAKPVSGEQLLATIRAQAPRGEILVVDDDRGFVQFVLRTLQAAGEGERLRWAYEGPAALEKMRAQPPALVLLDLILPGLTGWQIVEAMRKEPPLADIPVVMVSGAATGLESLPAGGEAFALVRPRGLRGDELARLIRSSLAVVPADYACTDTPGDQPETAPATPAF